MSVAFRRESDDEHLEPKFELPIPVGPNLVTPRGLALIEAKVVALEAQLAAVSDGDRPAALRVLRYWRTRLATAVPTGPAPDGTASIGTRVRFRLDGRERTITIVGHDEADPDAGLIAFAAPLAQALVGLGAGDRNDFQGREDAIEVVAVEAV